MKAVVFDLDGTLVHSAPDLHAAACAMLAQYGKPPLSLTQVTGFIGNGVPALVRRCLNAADADDIDVDDALSVFQARYGSAPTALSQPFDGVVAMLSAVTGSGRKLAVCTNKADDLTAAVLKGLALDGFFDTVVGGDTLPVKKPDPGPLILAVERLGAEVSEALYVGDSEVDAETAGNAGVDFALFAGGYRKTPVDELRARFVFDGFGQLTDFIRSHPA
jgi:phosphoglycolate phosphatase